ncbi:unnamed protein product [Staurois parvus]|uniref:Reverse transcriptase domain-containing protein n=1 Tax=Staurois parvus TaxID=386267 RepID=A0ABN9ESM6_9NEOB|nr:unnamed protein product [Staurois parvus]
MSTYGCFLGKYGLEGGFIDWLKTLYRGAESFMLVNGWIGRPFEVGSGVRQGCPLSPLLYAFVIDPFIRRFRERTVVWSSFGHSWGAPS